jgi:hypothetical protein
VQTAIVGAIVGKALHSIRRPLAKGRHRGVIQVNQVVADRKLVGVTFTKTRGGGRVCILNETHSLYNTLKWPKKPGGAGGFYRRRVSLKIA